MFINLFASNLKDEINNSINKNFSKYTYLKTYYKVNNYKPYFIENKKITFFAKELIEILEDDILYKPFIKTFFKKEVFDTYIKKEDFINAEIYLLNSYRQYAKLLINGFIDIKKHNQALEEYKKNNNLYINYEIKPNKVSKLFLLNDMKKDNSFKRLKELKKRTFFEYEILLKELQKYESLAKEVKFFKLTKTKVLKQNIIDDEVIVLRKRLISEGFLKASNCQDLQCEKTFDKEVKKAVKKFQKLHSLKVDAIVGRQTRDVLNITFKQKAKLLRLNLQRIRILKNQYFKEAFLLVNIPEYKLFVNGKRDDFINIIVGEKKFPTSVFQDFLTKIILNPYWKIPQSIVKNEILEKQKKTKNYLSKNEIMVHETWDEKSPTYDFNLVNWDIFYKNKDKKDPLYNLPLKFIQRPNNTNPLGKIKFVFPNDYAIYLHDTPFKNYFNHSTKAFSHGCIRVEKPIKLLEKLLSEQKLKVDTKQILSSNEKYVIKLEKKVPIFLLYLTTYINENKKLVFTKDIYNLDKLQLELF